MSAPLEDLAEALGGELGAQAARIERDLKMTLALEVERLRAERAEFELRVERAVAVRLAELKDGAAGPPGEPGAPAEAEPPPEDIEPMIAKGLALLADAPPLASAQAPVINITVPQPQPRTERSRVQHDAQGRVVAIERDVA